MGVKGAGDAQTVRALAVVAAREHLVQDGSGNPTLPAEEMHETSAAASGGSWRGSGQVSGARRMAPAGQSRCKGGPFEVAVSTLWDRRIGSGNDVSEKLVISACSSTVGHAIVDGDHRRRWCAPNRCCDRLRPWAYRARRSGRGLPEAA